jgi:hypothetical protein
MSSFGQSRSRSGPTHNIFVNNQSLPTFNAQDITCHDLKTSNLDSYTIAADNISVNRINDIDIKKHSSRHNFVGEDPLDPAVDTDITELSDYFSFSGNNNERIPRADHVHAHGNRGGGSLHSEATITSAGFMSANDKHKLDQISASSIDPRDLSVPYKGSSLEYARADHAHAHGLQRGGDLHQLANTVSAGFMSAEDKQKLILLVPGDNEPNKLSNISTSGSLLDYARADHVHAHGNLEGGTMHSEATTTSAGFMSAEDKIKLNLIIPGDNKPTGLSNISISGSSWEYARADHVHEHGNLLGGAMHAEATTTSAGFLSAEDKQKLINIPAGINCSVQYNKSGILSGSSDFTYDHSSNTLYTDNICLKEIINIPLKFGQILVGSTESRSIAKEVDGDLYYNGSFQLNDVNDNAGISSLSTVITNSKGLVIANTSATLEDSKIWIGSRDNVPTEVSVHGDATINSEGLLDLNKVNQHSGKTFLSTVITNSKGLVLENQSAPLKQGNIWIGSGENVPTEVSVHGDAVINNEGFLDLNEVNQHSGKTFLSTVITNSKGLVLENQSAPLKQGNIWVGSDLGIPTEVSVHGDATINSEGLLDLNKVNQHSGKTFLSTVITNEKGLVLNNASATLGDSKIWVGSIDNVPKEVSINGDASIDNTGAITLSTVNADPGLTTLSTVITNDKGLVIANKSAELKKGHIWMGSELNIPEQISLHSLSMNRYSYVYLKTDNIVIEPKKLTVIPIVDVQKNSGKQLINVSDPLNVITITETGLYMISSILSYDTDIEILEPGKEINLIGILTGGSGIISSAHGILTVNMNSTVVLDKGDQIQLKLYQSTEGPIKVYGKLRIHYLD